MDFPKETLQGGIGGANEKDDVEKILRRGLRRSHKFRAAVVKPIRT